MVPMVAAAENVSAVVFEAPNDAVPVGTVAGLQLAAEFQLFAGAAAPQAASWACAATETRRLVASIAAARPRGRRAKARMHDRRIAPSARIEALPIGRPSPAYRNAGSPSPGKLTKFP